MNPMQQMVMQMQKAQRELQKAHAELEAKVFKVNKAGLVNITILGSKEIVSIDIEEDGYELDNKEMVEELIRDGLNELFSQIDELAAQIDEKIAGKSGGLGF